MEQTLNQTDDGYDGEEEYNESNEQKEEELDADTEQIEEVEEETEQKEQQMEEEKKRVLLRRLPFKEDKRRKWQFAAKLHLCTISGADTSRNDFICSSRNCFLDVLYFHQILAQFWLLHCRQGRHCKGSSTCVTLASSQKRKVEDVACKRRKQEETSAMRTASLSHLLIVH